MNEEFINKSNICIGLLVEIVSDEDRATQKLTRGYIKEIVTKGNKSKSVTVILTSGKKGIIKHIVTKNELKRENFKFYNLFFSDSRIYSIWDRKSNKYLVIEHTNKTSCKMEKIAFLFNDEKIAQQVLNSLKNRNYTLRTINRKKPIAENFKTLGVQYFSINKDRKLSCERLVEWENYFKNMR